jgi:hypothetical protein
LTSGNDLFTYSNTSAPTVTAINSNTGFTTGGTAVTISGGQFTGATAVFFGSIAATSFTVLSDNAILAYTPAHAVGAVNVTVTTFSGTSSTSSNDLFTYTNAPSPAVISITPNAGATGGGTVVVLQGSGFIGASGVWFGSQEALSFAVNADTQLTATAPPQAAGTIDIIVTSAAGTSASVTGDRFTYTAAAAPAVAALGITSGTTAGGTIVSITGSGFTGATGVTFGTVAAASFTINSDTSITAVSPPQAAGTVDVKVTTPTGASASGSADQFTYNAAPLPTVTALSVATGPTSGGTLVTISGTNLAGVNAVHFGSVPATSFTYNADGTVSAVSPPQAAGTVDVTVTTPSGTSATSSADQFIYTNAPAPTVTGVTPNSGTTPGGNQVVITGANFTGASAVMFGSVAVTSFTVNSDNSITATAPPEAAGTVDVTVTTPSGTSATGSADHYTYTNVSAPAPAVTAVSPNTGSSAGGQTVTLTGTNFSGATAVTFGGTAATSFTINSDTSVTATAPAHSAAVVDIQVTTNNGTSSTGSADQFTYLSTPAPTVTSLGTTSGSTAGGTSVVITGTNFTGATAVYFGSVAASSFTVNSDTSITAVSPPQAAGQVDVTVTTFSGTSATGSADQFTYTNAPVPTVTSLGTTSGSTAGGTSVVIPGTNFTGAIGVSFGGVSALSFTVNSATQITATSPPDFVGTIDVTVSTFSGTSPTSSGDRFTYTAAATPAVTSLGTASGTTAGGTSVAVTGSGFTGASAVYFGNVPAASFTVNSDTSITAVSPPQAAGTVDVKVTTPTGTSASGPADQFSYTNAALPSVTGLGTNSGTTGGGTSVTITGSGFTGATGVSFGTVAAAGFTVNSDTSITAVSPPQGAGQVDVTVTTFSGTSSTGAADKFTYTAAASPAVTAVTPTSGTAAGGSIITVLGSGFTGASAVYFGTTPAQTFAVISDGALIATAPAGTGQVDVTVTTPTGTSSTGSADKYTYNAVAVPTVTSLNPSIGGTGGGTLVTISGSGFLTATGVSFGGTPATNFTIASDGVLTATAPPLPAGTIDVTVTNPGGTSALSAADRFVTNPALAPSVTSLGTTSGTTAGGTSVAITGTGFTGASAVSFGAVAAASFIVNSDTSITAISPSQAAGMVDVIVTTPTGTSATGSADQFTYTAAAAPAVSGLSLTTGSTAGGLVVDINGSGFTGATSVNFGTITTAFTVQSDSWIIATAPPQAAGQVDVTVTTPSGTSAIGAADKFTYTGAAAPAVTAITPTSGSVAGGTLVTVLGSGFTGASAINFGTSAAVTFTVLSDSALTAVAPSGTAGQVDVTVVTPSGTSATGAADKFTYTSVNAPTVTGVSPSSGSTGGGAVVIVTGTGFSTATAVSFGNYPATSYTINSDTQITATAPAQAAATVDVTVSDPAGTSATGTADQFTYNAATGPAVTAINPTTGPTGGGTNVAITGSGFTGASRVLFGSVAATSFRVNSDGSIFAVAPAEAAGTVDITVVTPSGTSATSSADQFTYQAPGTLGVDHTDVQFATVGTPWSGELGAFTDSPADLVGQYTATISWGDGYVTLSTVTAGTGTFSVSGTHTYTSAANYSVVVNVSDADGSSETFTASMSVTNPPHAPAAPAPKATGTQATATHGVAFRGNLASFLGSILGGTSSSYKASIDWGNGTTSSGQVRTTGNNRFGVFGGVTYAKPGTYTIKITITDSAGHSTTVDTTILVADARTDGEDEPGLDEDQSLTTAVVLAEDAPADDPVNPEAAADGFRGQSAIVSVEESPWFADARLGFSGGVMADGTAGFESWLVGSGADDEEPEDGWVLPDVPTPPPTDVQLVRMEATTAPEDQPAQGWHDDEAPYAPVDESEEAVALPDRDQGASDALFIALADSVAGEEAWPEEGTWSGWEDLLALPATLLAEALATL